jgi:hypothetical protein
MKISTYILGYNCRKENRVDIGCPNFSANWLPKFQCQLLNMTGLKKDKAGIPFIISKYQTFTVLYTAFYYCKFTAVKVSLPIVNLPRL